MTGEQVLWTEPGQDLCSGPGQVVMQRLYHGDRRRPTRLCCGPVGWLRLSCWLSWCQIGRLSACLSLPAAPVGATRQRETPLTAVGDTRQTETPLTAVAGRRLSGAVVWSVREHRPLCVSPSFPPAPLRVS